MRSLKLAALFAAVMLVWVNDVEAKEKGDWIIRAGVTYIDPKSDNGTLVVDPLDFEGTIRVDSATMLTFDGTYMFSDNFGLEVLAALPFKHDISVDGLGEVASVKHLPPTVSGVWNFNPSGTWQPYVGLGVNWTIFFDESEKGFLEDNDASLKLSNSLGFAAVFGLDVMLTERMFLNGNIRYMDIESDAKITIPGETDLVVKTTAKIDPWIYAINIGWVL
jgi:outer membrane protein